MPMDLGHFGDERLRQCGEDLLESLMACSQDGISVRRLGENRAGEVRYGRFLHNPRVTWQEMLSVAAARTTAMVQGLHVLVIQDTTTLRDDGDQISLNLHATIAVDAKSGAMLGLLHAEFLARTGGKRRRGSDKRAFEEKESARWLTAINAAAKLLTAGAARVTVVADRECDIYEVFALCPPEVELVIRVRHDRVLASGVSLFNSVRRAPPLGEEVITLPAKPGRAAREATLTVRACEVSLPRPRGKTRAKGLKSAVTQTLVEAREARRGGKAERLHWLLLTNRPVDTLSEALAVTHDYRGRWTIEQVFRTMKTEGFRIEQVKVSQGGPFENLVLACLIVAMRVMQLVHDRDGQAGRPMTDVFDAADEPALERVCKSLEGRTERQRNPHKKGSLARAAWICARLGGWTGYYGAAGPIVMLRGLLRFEAMRRDEERGRRLVYDLGPERYCGMYREHVDISYMFQNV